MFGKHSKPLEGLSGGMHWKGSEASGCHRSWSREKRCDAFHHALSKAVLYTSGVDPIVCCAPPIAHVVPSAWLQSLGKRMRERTSHLTDESENFTSGS